MLKKTLRKACFERDSCGVQGYLRPPDPWKAEKDLETLTGLEIEVSNCDPQVKGNMCFCRDCGKGRQTLQNSLVIPSPLTFSTHDLGHLGTTDVEYPSGDGSQVVTCCPKEIWRRG